MRTFEKKYYFFFTKVVGNLKISSIFVSESRIGFNGGRSPKKEINETLTDAVNSY